MQELNHHRTEDTHTVSLSLDNPQGLAVAELTTMLFDLEGSELRRDLKGWKLDTSRPFYFFNRLLVPSGHRRKGIGTRLLKAVVRAANREKFYIILQASSYDKKELPQASLEAFYLKHEFIRVEKNFLIYAPEGVMTQPAPNPAIQGAFVELQANFEREISAP